MSSIEATVKPFNYNKMYYESHKDKFKEWSKKKIFCDCCNKNITAPNYATHCKCATHLRNSQVEMKKSDIPKDKVFQLLELIMDRLKDKDLNDFRREVNGLSNLVINE